MFNGIVDNETVRSILSRQSIREFKPDMPSDCELETLMACALMSPSARNEQSCHVRFIKNPDMLAQMQRDFKDVVGWDTPIHTKSDVNPFYHNAPIFAAIFSEKDKYVDGGIMVENICIGAKGLGLGTCIVGSARELFEDRILGPQWKRVIEIPSNYKYLIGVAIGYANEEPELKERESDRVMVID